tara:strand:- start:166 stop:753 length:588 start_codon:yes stop_codon:yes gene_type:complete
MSPQIDFDGANSAVKTDKIQGQSGTTVTVPTSHTLAITDAGRLTVGGGAVLAGPTDVKFQAYPSSTASNVTGNGTAYTAVYGTEVFDTANAFSTSTFTAPETGKYLLTVTMTFSGVTAAADSFQISIVTSNRTYITPYSFTNHIGPSQPVRNSTVIADMDASDTAVVVVTGTGESGDVWDFEDAMNNVFFGALLA